MNVNTQQQPRFWPLLVGKVEIFQIWFPYWAILDSTSRLAARWGTLGRIIRSDIEGGSHGINQAAGWWGRVRFLE